LQPHGNSTAPALDAEAAAKVKAGICRASELGIVSFKPTVNCLLGGSVLHDFSQVPQGLFPALSELRVVMPLRGTLKP
jgi:hypothetical protein